MLIDIFFDSAIPRILMFRMSSTIRQIFVNERRTVIFFVVKFETFIVKIVLLVSVNIKKE